MSAEYTPTTEEVRDAYVEGMVHDCYYEGDVKLTPDGVYEANRFNAWLTEYTRVKQAEAWDEGRLVGLTHNRQENPYRKETK